MPQQECHTQTDAARADQQDPLLRPRTHMRDGMHRTGHRLGEREMRLGAGDEHFSR